MNSPESLDDHGDTNESVISLIFVFGRVECMATSRNAAVTGQSKTTFDFCQAVLVRPWADRG